MLQVFIAVLAAVTFVLMAADPRSFESTEAKSAWQKQVSSQSEHIIQQKSVDSEQV